MADSSLLASELNETETMGEETTRLEELLLQVRTGWIPASLGVRGLVLVLRDGTTAPRMH
jgi:hypothetical protein